MTGNDTHLLLKAFFAELERCGLEHACISPGSRSVPLILAASAQRKIRCWSHIDERCGGFFALGIGKASRVPAAVICTSGTAVAELLPAVVEAYEGGVPMVVLTADRPPELRGIGAGQTIDQLKLYGNATKWFFEVGTHTATPERYRWIKSLAHRAYWTALSGRPGPVHLNFPLREPLVPTEPLDDSEVSSDQSSERASRYFFASPPLGGNPAEPAYGETLAYLTELVERTERGVVICGRQERYGNLAEVAAKFTEQSGFVLLADPLSGARSGGTAAAHYDLLLRHTAFAERHRPDLVIQIGELPTSKPLRQWLSSGGFEHFVFDPEELWHNSTGTVTVRSTADGATVLRALTQQRLKQERRTNQGWTESWLSADRTAASLVMETLGETLSEPRLAAELANLLPREATLFVASSLPVREIESFWPTMENPPRVLSNRGANGIDGTVSTTFGIAATTDSPVILLCGDVTLTYDLTGLIAAKRLGLNITVVLINNGGGGIFDFLPVAGSFARYEELIATPPQIDFAKAAELFDFEHVEVDSVETFTQAFKNSLRSDRPGLIEIRSNRSDNTTLYKTVNEKLELALNEKN